MVRNVFALDNLRNIRRTLSRYLSILIITLLGVSFFSGLGATGSAMRQTAETYLNDKNFMDLRLLSTVGFDDDDYKAVQSTGGVMEAEGVYSTDVVCQIGADNYSYLLISVPQKLNIPLTVEGRMPEKSGECAVDWLIIKNGECKIGDTLTFSSGTSDPIGDKLKRDTFKVVGAVENPLYLSSDRGASTVGSGSSDGYIMVPGQDFDMDVYTEVYIGAEASGYSRFSDEYLSALKHLKDNLEDTGLTRGGVRYADITRDIRKEIADAKVEIADGYAELDDAKAKLDDGRKELDDGYKEYNENKLKFEQEIADAQKTLDDGYAEYREGYSKYLTGLDEFRQKEREAEEKLVPAEEELARGREQYEKGAAELEDAKQLRDGVYGVLSSNGDMRGQALAKELASQVGGSNEQLSKALASYAVDPLNTYNADILRAAAASMSSAIAENEEKLGAAQAQLTRGQAEIDQGRAQLEEGRAQLADSKTQLDDAKSKLDEGQAELDDSKMQAEAEFADAWQELMDGENEWGDGNAEFLAKYGDAIADLKQAEQDVADAEQQLAEFEAPEWYVLDNETNAGFMSYKQDTGRLDVLGVVIPIFFFMIAVFVTMTSMTRLVESQRGYIGTMKSIGYSRWKIASRYLYYALSASVIGGIIGAVGGIYFFPAIIFNAYGQMYTLPPLSFGFPWGLAAVSVLLAAICATLPAFFVCLATLREAPAMLMRPEAPKAGRRVFLERVKFLWNRLSFSQKVSMRNIFRYKKRLIMTLIGVAGCTALMFLGFALKDSIVTILPHQYGDIMKYDMRVGFDTDDDNNPMDSMLSFAGVTGGTIVYNHSVDAAKDNMLRATTLIVPEDPVSFVDFVNMKDAYTKQPITLGPDTVVMAERLAALLNLAPGDEFKMRDSDGVELTVKLSAVMENYLDHFVIVPPDLYNSKTGLYPEYNQGYYKISVTGDKQDALSTELMSKDGITAVSFISESRGIIEGMLDALQIIVVVLVVCAGALLFVVQFSLISINIEERVRELATIKVLGFTESELAAYIFRESNLLTLLGSILGLFAGVALQRFIIKTMETNFMMFSRDLLWPSFVWSAVLTIVFALIIDMIMMPHIKKIDMISSLKSVE